MGGLRRGGLVGALVGMLAAVWWIPAVAEIIVDPQIVRTAERQATLLRAGSLVAYELGTFDEGEAVGVQVEVNNAVYKDVSAFIVDAPNMALARQNLRFT